MEKMQILQAELLDLLFEGRNKNYGAYDLRKNYNKRMEYALMGTFVICLLFIVGNLFANRNRTIIQEQPMIDVVLDGYKEKEKDKILPPPPKEKIVVAAERYNVPVITPDKLVAEEDEMKPVEALENVQIGNEHVEGVEEQGLPSAPVEASIGKDYVEPVKQDYDVPFTVVQIQARFPDGLAGWTKFLEKNLNRDLPVNNGAPAGIYTVVVSFVVNKAGVISEVQAENDPGYGTGAEAVRAIKKGPNWIPAEQNGTKVVYRQRQAISFKVSEDE
ncbi:MAG: energy transducer TonB [Chitinophagaceae bacterium BSSC1]|nr:MAG: energy transducer TonB [Chitinophagaceae bacterium BSSC1]